MRKIYPSQRRIFGPIHEKQSWMIKKRELRECFTDPNIIAVIKSKRKEGWAMYYEGTMLA